MRYVHPLGWAQSGPHVTQRCHCTFRVLSLLTGAHKQHAPQAKAMTSCHAMQLLLCLSKIQVLACCAPNNQGQPAVCKALEWVDVQTLEKLLNVRMSNRCKGRVF